MSERRPVEGAGKREAWKAETRRWGRSGAGGDGKDRARTHSARGHTSRDGSVPGAAPSSSSRRCPVSQQQQGSSRDTFRPSSHNGCPALGCGSWEHFRHRGDDTSCVDGICDMHCARVVSLKMAEPSFVLPLPRSECVLGSLGRLAALAGLPSVRALSCTASTESLQHRLPFTHEIGAVPAQPPAHGSASHRTSITRPQPASLASATAAHTPDRLRPRIASTSSRAPPVVHCTGIACGRRASL